MNDITLILEVTGLFLFRIGLPLMALVTLGIIIDRWQTNREVEFATAEKPASEIIAMDEQTNTVAEKQHHQAA